MDSGCRGIFIVGLSCLISVYADDIAKNTSQDSGCASRLAEMKAEVEKAEKTSQQLFATTIFEPGHPTSTPPEEIGKPHWPEDTSAYTPPLALYWRELKDFLRTVKPQTAPAGVALAFGLINVLNGPASFKSIVIGGFALVAACSARYEVALVWPELNMKQQIAVAVEIGLVTAFVFHKSFDGARVLIGVMFGLGVSMVLEQVMHTEYWPLNTSFIWYSFFALGGAFSLTTGQRFVLSLITPLLGGFLCASALGFLIKTGLEQNFQGTGQAPPSWMDLRGDCWLDFAHELLGGPSNAGVAKIVQVSPVTKINVDKLLGFFLWFLLFFFGAKRQWRLAKENTREDIRNSLLGPQKIASY